MRLLNGARLRKKQRCINFLGFSPSVIKNKVVEIQQYIYNIYSNSYRLSFHLQTLVIIVQFIFQKRDNKNNNNNSFQ